MKGQEKERKELQWKHEACIETFSPQFSWIASLSSIPCFMYISPYASRLREPERRQSCCRCRRAFPLCWSLCRALLRLRTPWPGAGGSESPPPRTDGWYLDGAAFPCSISPGRAVFGSFDRAWSCPRSWWLLCLWMKP